MAKTYRPFGSTHVEVIFKIKVTLCGFTDLACPQFELRLWVTATKNAPLHLHAYFSLLARSLHRNVRNAVRTSLRPNGVQDFPNKLRDRLQSGASGWRQKLLLHQRQPRVHKHGEVEVRRRQNRCFRPGNLSYHLGCLIQSLKPWNCSSISGQQQQREKQ